MGSFKATALRCLEAFYPSRHQPLPRDKYSPVRVSIRSISPSLMNSGTRTMAPVSSLAGFEPPVAVSPRTPGSVSTTLSSMCAGGVTCKGTPFQRYHANGAFLQPLRAVTHGLLGRGELFEGVGHHEVEEIPVAV